MNADKKPTVKILSNGNKYRIMLLRSYKRTRGFLWRKREEEVEFWGWWNDKKPRWNPDQPPSIGFREDDPLNWIFEPKEWDSEKEALAAIDEHNRKVAEKEAAKAKGASENNWVTVREW